MSEHVSSAENSPMTFQYNQSKSQILTMPASHLFSFIPWTPGSLGFSHWPGVAPPPTLTLRPLHFPRLNAWLALEFLSKSWPKGHLLSEAPCSKLSKTAPTSSSDHPLTFTLFISSIVGDPYPHLTQKKFHEGKGFCLFYLLHLALSRLSISICCMN